MERSSIKQIDRKSINILYNPISKLTPTEKIDNDSTQSYWLALQFVPTKKNKPDRIFTLVCHTHPTECYLDPTAMYKRKTKLKMDSFVYAIVTLRVPIMASAQLINCIFFDEPVRPGQPESSM